jgi:hypothetical protein
MIQSQLFFGLNYDYDQTLNALLEKESALRVWDKGKKTYLYIFPLKSMPTIKAILGKPINITMEDINLLNKDYPQVTENKVIEPYKGKGYINILSRGPTVYSVEFPMRKKPAIVKIPVEMVNALWKVLQKYPIGLTIDTRIVARSWCQALGITRFNRAISDSFNWKLLLGSRKDYFKLYYGLKILQIDCVIDYLKTGKVIRLKDMWEQQGILQAKSIP